MRRGLVAAALLTLVGCASVPVAGTASEQQSIYKAAFRYLLRSSSYPRAFVYCMSIEGRDADAHLLRGLGRTSYGEKLSAVPRSQCPSSGYGQRLDASRIRWQGSDSVTFVFVNEDLHWPSSGVCEIHLTRGPGGWLLMTPESELMGGCSLYIEG